MTDSSKASLLYVNIPFCRELCTFCNFYKQSSKLLDIYFSQNRLAEALIAELKLRRHQLHPKLKSFYLGGGSPYEIDLKQIEPFLEYLSTNYDLSETEKTIELNPSPFVPNSLISFFNRFSMGIQSFSFFALKIMGRPHRAILSDIEKWRDYSKNFSIDMIYDIPGTHVDRLNNDLKKVIYLDPDHVSWYSLELDNLGIAQQLPDYKDENNTIEGHEIKISLDKIGLKAYEISNFAKPNKHSIHNLGYWQMENYVGVGPGAVGAFYDEKAYRYTNHTSLNHYLYALKQGSKPEKDREFLSESQKLNEFVMLSLRQKHGLNLRLFKKKFRQDFLEMHEETINRYRNYLNFANGYLSLKTNGISFFNTICSDFFIVE